MILAKKVRIIPNVEQEQKLWQSVGTARFIYNWTLARQEENYKNGGKFIKDGDLRKELTILKKSELNWLNEVSNNVAKQAVKDACNAYKNFFKGLTDKPKFKSRRRSKPSFYNDTDKLKVKEKIVLIEKVGWVETVEQIPMDVKYINPRISFDGKFWYISVGIEKEEPISENTGISIGIDLGLKDLAIVSNIDTPFKNINKTKEVKRLKKKLKRKQKQVSRKYEDGKILPVGDYKLNNKVEVKNIGSITAVEKSIEYEVKRLTEEITNGKEIIQQTRGWNADKGITEFQRSKETADDYRYMPEPDIPVIEVSKKDIERISNELVELPHEKITRYTKDYDISTYAAEVISSTKENASYFESLLAELKPSLDEKTAAKEAANWLMGTVYSIGKDVDIKDLALLIKKFRDGIITKGVAEELLKNCLENNKDISDELEKFESSSKENSEKLEDIVKDIIARNPKAVADYKGGKESTIGYLVGQVMQSTKGSANPNEAKNILVKLLK